MELGLSIPIQMKLEQQLNYTMRAQEIGINHIWVGDNPPINNTFLTIAQLACKVKEIEFWTGITSPFYYIPEVLIALSRDLSSNYQNRFGLALGIGNSQLFSSQNGLFQSFVNRIGILNKLREERNIKHEVNFPLGIGGLGSKMCRFALNSSDILLLNSTSEHDLDRISKICSEHEGVQKEEYRIYTYGMFQVLKENAEMSLTTWNITKDIAKGCSNVILKSHGYNSATISKIRDLPWERMDNIPKGELKEIVYDFAIVGEEEQILEKIDSLVFNRSNYNIEGLVLGWIFSENQWDFIKEIRKKV